MLKVDKDVALPPVPERLRSEPFYPWPKMSVGDSFLTEKVMQRAAAVTSFLRHQKLGRIPEDCYYDYRREGEGHRFWLCRRKPAVSSTD